jgi:hypothetical protein
MSSAGLNAISNLFHVPIFIDLAIWPIYLKQTMRSVPTSAYILWQPLWGLYQGCQLGPAKIKTLNILPHLVLERNRGCKLLPYRLLESHSKGLVVADCILSPTNLRSDEHFD